MIDHLANYITARAPFKDWRGVSVLTDETHFLDPCDCPDCGGNTITIEQVCDWLTYHPCVSGDIDMACEHWQAEFGAEMSYEDFLVEPYYFFADEALKFSCAGCREPLEFLRDDGRIFCDCCIRTMSHKTVIIRRLKAAGLDHRIITKPRPRAPFWCDPDCSVIDLRRLENEAGITSSFLKLRRRNKDGDAVPRMAGMVHGLYYTSDVKRYLASPAAGRHHLPEKATEIRELLLREQLARVESKIKYVSQQLNRRTE